MCCTWLRWPMARSKTSWYLLSSWSHSSLWHLSPIFCPTQWLFGVERFVLLKHLVWKPISGPYISGNSLRADRFCRLQGVRPLNSQHKAKRPCQCRNPSMGVLWCWKTVLWWMTTLFYPSSFLTSNTKCHCIASPLSHKIPPSFAGGIVWQISWWVSGWVMRRTHLRLRFESCSLWTSRKQWKSKRALAEERAGHTWTHQDFSRYCSTIVRHFSASCMIMDAAIQITVFLPDWLLT